MRNIGSSFWAGIISVVVLAQAQAQPSCLSPVAVAASADGKTLYVAEATANRVAVVDPMAGKATSQVALPTAPNGLALSSDGKRLFVSCDGPDGVVCAVDLPAGKVAATLTAGYTPMSPVLSPDGKTLYVANRFNNDISVLDVNGGKEAARIAVSREPVALALTPDGQRLVVAHLLPTQPSTDPVVAVAVTIVDMAARKAVATVVLPNGSTGARDVCLSPDGKFAYVTHILGRYRVPTTQLDRGWMNTNALSVVDVGEPKLVNTVLLDEKDRGAANPWPIACTSDGRLLVVGCAGSQELLLVDRAGLHARLDEAATGKKMSEATSKAEDVPNDLAFLFGLRERLALAGNGPRALALAGDRAFVTEYFTDTVAVVDLAGLGGRVASSVALGPTIQETAVRRGELLFNDARQCFQTWQSCASCHPDARADGLNWDLLNDGIGNPKNTRSMLLAHQTPPVMSLGVRDSAERAVRAGFKFIQFATVPEEDAVAVDEYLKSLQPLPSPRLVKGQLSDSAKRGEVVYKTANCAKCHSEPLLTDLKMYDVGTGVGREKDKKFDNPTLREIWRTAPYLYDGRAATMMNVLTDRNKEDRHGVTTKLTPEQLKDLEEYVCSQ